MSGRSRFVVLSLLLGCALWIGAAAAEAPRVIPGEVLIKYKPAVTGAARANFRAMLRGHRLHEFGFVNIEHVKLDQGTVDDAIRRYRNDPRVEYIEPNYEIHAELTPNDPRFSELYGMRNTGQTGGTAGADIKAVNAWDLFIGDPNLLVGVIDTGVDYNHPDLMANVWTNPGEIPGNGIDDDDNGFVDDVHGYDFVNNDGDPFDDNGHGTHCSGTIAGVGNNNVGVVGVCWQSKIVGIKFLNAAGSGSTAGAIAGVQYAITIGVKLTSNSWGGGGFSQALLDAINAAGAAGQLFVAAAGNAGANTDVSPSYPASYDSPYIISVAATDHNDGLASFSNFGATTVDIAAPGVNILSCQPGGGYQLLSGTSMATPHVSGVVALTMGRFPGITNLQAKALILNGADHKAQLAGKCVTGGRLNAFLSIAEPDTIPPGAIASLATSNAGSNTMGLSWTATGDDGATGRASRYDIRYSTSPIDAGNFAAATPVVGPDPQPAGSSESFEVGGLAFSTLYYFALKALDEFGNAGPISNVATGTTLGIPDVAAAPGSFNSTLLTGAVDTQTLALTNAGAGTLDFTVPTPDLVFTQPVTYEFVPTPKNGPDVRVGSPVATAHGGPDGFGYRWVDSNEAGGPAFSWADITGVGSLLTLTGDDATSAPVPIGFDFPYYGGAFNSIRVCTNGWLSFTDVSSAFENQPLPNAGAPANIVAPFWDDLDFGAVNHVYTYNDGTRFIVSWVGAPHFQTGGPYTFQAILYPTGEIRFQYLSMGSPTNSATAGIQNGTGTIGLTVAFNTDYVTNNLAVRVVPLAQWLTVSPTSGRIAAGDTRNLNVQFNALGLDGGNYAGNIRVLSNDPDGSPLVLPAALHVIGAPDIAVTPASIAFGTVFVGATPTQTLTVSNPGTDDLVVSGISSDHPFVTANPSAFTLAPHAAITVDVRFAPTSPAAVAATLFIVSNDPDTPEKTVAVTGTAVPAPNFTVTPASLSVTLPTNTATTRTLRVSNTGGSNYVFTSAAEILGQSGTVTVQGDADNIDLPKGAGDVQAGPEPLRAGGPDVFGYTYQDSDEPGGPTFAWQDIRAVGTQIVMTGDDANTGPHPIGFSFPFYGNGFSSFRVCTNGFVSFTSSLTTFTNTSLPNNGSTVPDNLLAVFWDDLHFDTARKAYYYNDGTKLIIQYQDVRRIGESATTNPNSFEILLFPNGTIVYQYLSMLAATKTSATIGIQNNARNDGLQVVFNAAYVKNSLAIRFRPPARFLTVTPSGGTVPPGGFVDLTVGFNASGLFGGDYTGQVKITGNDPVVPVKNVPANLTVIGVPDLALSPGSLDFGSVFIGFPQVRNLRINNVGTDNLVVSNITLSDSHYGVDNTSFSVPPLGTALVFVTFGPSATGALPATLTVHSNDPDTPEMVLPLAGTGLVAPDIDPVPAAVSATLNIPATDTQTLALHNLGGSDLSFVVGVQLNASSVEIHEELPLAKEQPDPRPGILGSGGPDLFGYTWRDSDEPGGPVFDWVDITGIGTPVTLPTGDDANVAGIPIGFDFSFYGATFNTVNVCTNGWLSFTSTATALTNQPLPNSGSGVPENLLAVFWDDLLPGTSPSRIFRYSDGTRFILSYVGVPRFSSGGPYTFQVILYPSGRIVYQYLDMQGTRLNEATIGIQNATRTDGLTVVHNAAYVHNGLAVELRTTPEYLSVVPTSGTVPAGGSLDLAIGFNTAGLFGGEYHGALRITSNDPDEAVTVVPTTLHAVGVPDIAAAPASLDFGPVYVGLSRDLDVEVRNAGTDQLVITGASLPAPDWSLVGASFPITLGQNAHAILRVRFSPTTPWQPPDPCLPAQARNATLTIASNDPDGPFGVPLAGVAVIPPEIDASPASLRAALATTLGPSALTRTKTLLVRNLGCSDLNWTAEALSALPASLVAAAGEGAKNDPGAPGALGAGGPDAFGYRWADSDDPNGPAFSWVDISGVGTPIALNGDDQNLGPFPLPFAFPFYGGSFNSFRICSNGWISFTSTATAFTNAALPGSSAPENLIAPFWDDLDFRPASGSARAYSYYDGTRYIISFVNVPHFTSGGPYTFEVLLYPSGTIDFQYLDMQSTRLNEATIGIQNAAKDVGLQMVFNAAYVKNNLRVRITNRPGWLTVSPLAGVIPAGQQATLSVGFDATGLADGDYTGMVRIASNDLNEPLTSVPCDLHVGVAPGALDLDPNTLNRSSNGNWVLGKVTPPGGANPNTIRTASVLLERAVPVAPGAPITYSGPDAQYKFDRLALMALLPSGNAVPVEVIGEVTDVTWFVGLDSVRVLKPKVVASGSGGQSGSGNGVYPTGQSVLLSWENPEGYVADSFDLWYSADAGDTWTAVESGLSGYQYLWRVPETPTEHGVLELVAVDALGPMGSWLSTFRIAAGITGVEPGVIPERFGLRLASRNPAVGGARLELALPARGEVNVRVHDVTGALVRELTRGVLEPGMHPLQWDGSDNAGRPVRPGIYFVQAVTRGEASNVRIAFVR